MTRNSGGRHRSRRSKRRYRSTSPASQLAKRRINHSSERVEPCRTSAPPAIANFAYIQSSWDTVDVRCNGKPVCTVNTFLKTVRFDVHAVTSINVTVVNDAVTRCPPTLPPDMVSFMTVKPVVDGRGLVEKFNVTHEHDFHIFRIRNNTKLEVIHRALDDNYGTTTILFLCDNDLPPHLWNAMQYIKEIQELPVSMS